MNEFVRHPLAMDGKDPSKTRVRRFHEVLHDYLNGNPPGRPR